ncbi:MAG: virulence factor SrfB [Labilithrix sp.]|nr:virulence factor SrfB [Labilithrix sp.]MCW5814418.1 virulence factor SrfB [Labilithrix sp.]
MVKKKVSLGGSSDGDAPSAAEVPNTPGSRAASIDVLELFFNTGIILHEVALPRGLPAVVSSFIVMRPAGAAAPAPSAAAISVRRAQTGEEPDVEISAVDHLSELAGRWLPVPFQLSCPFAVQVYLATTAGGGARAVLAIDTLEAHGSQGRHLDAAYDEGRPFRALDKNEVGQFFEHAETRELVRRLERAGVEKAVFKLAALLETLSPLLPKIRFSRLEASQPIPVSLVLDLGNSRSTALLVEGRGEGVFGVPLEMRSLGNPLATSQEAFDSRITFLPSPWDKTVFPVATGESFQWPSVARMGREALDRALETPHRYQCTLSGPKRYLWDDRLTDERWFFATKIGQVAPGQGGEHRPVFGKILKYLPEESGGTFLREDGPQTPADPRYAPRAMMMFALVEILCQAYAQINGAEYRMYQGKEGNPRVLKHLVLTYPSAMREEERRVYDVLVRNAVLLACHVLNIRPELRPNYNPQTQQFDPFLFVDEALAAQMVFVYQEVQGTFSGSMEELVSVYGHETKTLRVASVDIGGGTTDVMVAEYEDKLPGTGTSLSIKKLFQDGVSIAGDEVCRAIVEDVVFPQILHQLPTQQAKSRLLHLFGEGDAGHGSAWRTLRARLVPYLWMPLARCYWSVAEGFQLPNHTPDRHYMVSTIFETFGLPAASPAILGEGDKFLEHEVEGWPGFQNLFFRFDALEVERAIERVLREPLRRYADILAQFDVDLLVLAGRTSAIPCIKRLFTNEMPVSPPRIRSMAKYKVGEWYPSKWKDQGTIRDPKSTVTAGAAVLHLASRNKLPGFLIDDIVEAEQRPIYGLYQDVEPHIARANELFPGGANESQPFVYTHGMRVGFRNVDSQEMEGSPLLEVRPANADVESALLEDRVAIRFGRARDGSIQITNVQSQRNTYQFDAGDFTLALKTAAFDRYWLDTGVFKSTTHG